MRVLIEILRGSDQIARIPFFDQACLNGFTAWAQLRKSPRSEEVLDELTTENGRIKIGCGYFLLSFPHEVTQNWKFRRAVFDIKAISLEGGQVRLAEGRVLVIPEVTR